MLQIMAMVLYQKYFFFILKLKNIYFLFLNLREIQKILLFFYK